MYQVNLFVIVLMTCFNGYTSDFALSFPHIYCFTGVVFINQRVVQTGFVNQPIH